MHFNFIAGPHMNRKKSAVLFLHIVAVVFVLAMTLSSARGRETKKQYTLNERSKRSTDGIIKQTDSSSIWSKLQITPDAIGSLPFGNYRIDIYEHSGNKLVNSMELKRYYYAPVALLDHKSASSRYNNITKQPEMSFRIQMWSEEIQKSVVDYIGELILNPVREKQVNVLPLKMKIMLSSDSNFNNVYRLKREWLTYQQHQFIKFTLVCFYQSECDELAENMRSSPDQFSQFKLLFTPFTSHSQRKEFSVGSDKRILSDIVQMINKRFPEANEVYLTSEYENRLIGQSVENILMEIFENFEVISSTSEKRIFKDLQSMLESSEYVIGKALNDPSWELLFWDEVNYRPDKSAVTLNNIYSRLNDDQQKKFLASFNVFNGNQNGELEKILLPKSTENVKWDGTKFIPKPMKVSKINLAKLREQQQLNNEHRFRVTYLTAVMNFPVNIDPYYDPITSNQLFYIQNKVSKMDIKLAGLLHKHTECSGISLSSTKTKGGLPTSCLELNCLEHTINGFYSVRGSNMSSSKLETVFCDFNQLPSSPSFESRIGYVDVKSSQVYFYVQRNSTFSTGNVPVSFELERLNIGGAMSITSGVFTAPLTGIYQFSLPGISARSATVHVTLRLNDANVAYSLGDSTGQHGTFSLASTLKLKSGDRIDLVLLHGGTIDDNGNHFTHFTGWLIEETVS